MQHLPSHTKWQECLPAPPVPLLRFPTCLPNFYLPPTLFLNLTSPPHTQPSFLAECPSWCRVIAPNSLGPDKEPASFTNSRPPLARLGSDNSDSTFPCIPLICFSLSLPFPLIILAAVVPFSALSPMTTSTSNVLAILPRIFANAACILPK